MAPGVEAHLDVGGARLRYLSWGARSAQQVVIAFHGFAQTADFFEALGNALVARGDVRLAFHPCDRLLGGARIAVGADHGRALLGGADRDRAAVSGRGVDVLRGLGARPDDQDPAAGEPSVAHCSKPSSPGSSGTPRVLSVNATMW